MNEALVAYLKEVIGVTVMPLPTALEVEKLPYYLVDAFELDAVAIEGFSLTLATPRVRLDQRLEETVKQLKQISDRLSQAIVFCPKTLASYERRNLIRYRMAFIVPGKQLYLPHLGIDLRERVPQAELDLHRLSPSTQSLLIWSLLNMPAQDEWEPAQAAAALQYTPMVASRAGREMEAAGLMSAKKMGRFKCLKRIGTPVEIWSRAQPYLRNPVQREIWVDPDSLGLLDRVHLRKSGIPALVDQTLLDGNKEVPCFAIPHRQWQLISEQVQPLAGYESGAVRLQIWLYETAIYQPCEYVDPLSLCMSLSHITDERIQIALDELLEKIKW
jgi:hypothetical protein